VASTPPLILVRWAFVVTGGVPVPSCVADVGDVCVCRLRGDVLGCDGGMLLLRRDPHNTPRTPDPEPSTRLERLPGGELKLIINFCCFSMKVVLLVLEADGDHGARFALFTKIITYRALWPRIWWQTTLCQRLSCCRCSNATPTTTHRARQPYPLIARKAVPVSFSICTQAFGRVKSWRIEGRVYDGTRIPPEHLPAASIPFFTTNTG